MPRTPSPAVVAARDAVRSIRFGRVDPMPSLGLPVRDGKGSERRSETVRDGLDPAPATGTPDGPSAETGVLDPRTGRFYELTARQMSAIHLLTMGKSVVATAQSLGVGVSTLHRWKSKQPAFIAELNRRQTELFDRTIDKLRLTMSMAVEELYAMMTGDWPGKREEVMRMLLPMLQPRKWMQPTGATDPQDVIDASVRDRRKRHGEDARAEVSDEERDAAIAEAEVAVGPATPALEPSPGTPGEGRVRAERGEASPEAKAKQTAERPDSSPPFGPHPSPLPEYRERGPEGTARPFSIAKPPSVSADLQEDETPSGEANP